ncbi:MAG: hypothetical protein QM817_38235 [Archangium sp.]
MGELPDWPKALEHWEPELRFFAREFTGHLAKLSDRLFQALGPLRISNEQRSDEPNGYSALSRRGPYERLLASEWAMQLEDPDEFIRRASSGEHLFVELERRSPAASLEAWLFVDTGPGQLGSPRIGQLAALVAFARRARAANVRLHWAPLWNWEQPVLEGLDPKTVRTWLDSRTPWEPTTGVFSQWSSRWTVAIDPTIQRDVWVVGAPSILPLAVEHDFGAITLDDSAGDGNELEVTVQPARRRRTHTLRLQLPESSDRVRLLRDPFEWRKAKAPPPKPKPQSTTRLPLEPDTELAFSHDSHRLLARAADGSAVAIPIRNTPRAGYGWPTLALLPPYTKLIACSWTSRRERALIVRGEKATWLADWDGRTIRRLDDRHFGSVDSPRANDLFVGGALLTEGWTRRGLWFSPTKRDAPTHRTQIAACVGARNMCGVRVGSPATFVDEGFEWWLSVETFPHRAWVTRNWNTLVAATLDDERLTVSIATPSPNVVRNRLLPRALLANDELFGVTTEAVFSLHNGGRAIRSLKFDGVAPQWEEEVRARAPIDCAVISPNSEVLAWRDQNGELGIYSRKRRETVLRLHVNDVMRELT